MTVMRQSVLEPPAVTSVRLCAVRQAATARAYLSRARQRSVPVTNSVAQSPFMLSTEQKGAYERDGTLGQRNLGQIGLQASCLVLLPEDPLA